MKERIHNLTSDQPVEGNSIGSGVSRDWSTYTGSFPSRGRLRGSSVETDRRRGEAAVPRVGVGSLLNKTLDSHSSITRLPASHTETEGSGRRGKRVNLKSSKKTRRTRGRVWTARHSPPIPRWRIEVPSPHYLVIWDPTLLFSPALSCLRDPSLLSWREEVLISFPACFTAIDLWIQLKKRTPQTKIEWLGRRSPPAYLIHQKATWPAYWFFLRGSTKIWKKGTRVPNWNHGKSLLCKYTKSSHSSKTLLPSLIWVVLFGIWFYLPFL